MIIRRESALSEKRRDLQPRLTPVSTWESVDQADRSPRKPMQVVILALPGASPMNLFGAAEVFAKANALLSESAYQVRIVSATTRECPTAFLTTLKVDSTINDVVSVGKIDTLLVAGGNTTAVQSLDYEHGPLLDWS